MEKKSPNVAIATVIGAVAIVALVLVSSAFAAPLEDRGAPKASRVELLKEARERAKTEAKEDLARYKEAVSTYKDARTDFLSERARSLPARNGTAKLPLLDKAKAYMLKSADSLLALIGIVRNEAVLVTAFNSTDAEGLENLQEKWLSELDSAESNVTALKSKISNATDRQDLVALSKEMKGTWDSVRKLSHRIYYLARVEKGIVLYGKAKSVSENLGAKVSALNWTNASAVESALSEAESRLSKAKELFSSAKISFGEENIPEGNRLMRDAHKELSAAVKSLRSAHTEYLKLTKGAGRNPRANSTEES